MRVIVASQAAGIASLRIRDRIRAVRRNHIDIEIHEPHSGNGAAGAPHSVRGVANRAGKAIVNHMAGMLTETCIRRNLTQVVTFAAKRVRSVYAEVWVRKEIGDQLTGRRCLAELVTALQNVRPLRTVWAVRACPAELAIVVAVVTIRAENLRSHAASLCDAVQIEHIRQQAGLGQSTAANVSNRVARSTGDRKLRDHVQKIARRNQPHGRIPEDGINGFARAGSMAAQTILELVDRGIHRGNAIGGAHSGHAVL